MRDGDYMPTFVVNTAILQPRQEPEACARGTPEMIANSGIKNVETRSCYCCTEHGSVTFIMEGPSRDKILEAFNRINVPVASILEAREVPIQQKAATVA
jgi:hypothetical protein